MIDIACPAAVMMISCWQPDSGRCHARVSVSSNRQRTVPAEPHQRSNSVDKVQMLW